ncbi:MAG: translation elongation factor 4 [Chloroflexota bacterium]|nr:translation elongation factor 4 [Chloroflexota bacterium]
MNHDGGGDQAHTRNFCIIAHIDHGKSTLADRMLERTATLSARQMRDQVLDSMDLERERGITIKAHPVRMSLDLDGTGYTLNLIDTPGHVDFSYEVSRSLAACEGAVLLVDATQGIEAQTLANAYVAVEHDLAVIPVVNKIDLPTAQADVVAQEVADFLGTSVAEVLQVSAKSGEGVDELLRRIVAAVPPPAGDPAAPLRALVVDSSYDQHRGVVASVRVFDGSLHRLDRLRLMQAGTRAEAVETGVFTPAVSARETLTTGHVGYVATGLKEVREWPVGDTVTHEHAPARQPLAGYRTPKPLVFASLYSTDPEGYTALRDALDRLRLSDPAIVSQPEQSAALGFGFRCGFLGVLHMDIVRERLEREYELELVLTTPQVEYEVARRDGEVVRVDSPAELPEPSQIAEVREPWMVVTVVTPEAHLGAVIELLQARRGEHRRLEYLEPTRVLLEYGLPLGEMLTEFFDALKSSTRGYGSLDYTFGEYRAGDFVRLDMRLNGQMVDALSTIVPRARAAEIGRDLALRLKREIPRQQFEVSVQAAVGSRIVARETVRPVRKDVLAKCYGRDVSRKRKLLEAQKAGKRRLKRVGQIDVPQEAFTAVLRSGGPGGTRRRRA